MNYRVNVYTLDTIYSRFKDPVKTLVSPQARQTGGGSESVKLSKRYAKIDLSILTSLYPSHLSLIISRLANYYKRKSW